MTIKDIEIGEYYRLKSSKGETGDYYGWVKVLGIYPRGHYENPLGKKAACVKCQHTINKNDVTGFVRWFNVTDLVRA